MHQYEKALLISLKKGEGDSEELSKRANLSTDSIIRAAGWLQEKEAVKVREESSETVELSKEGKLVLEEGFPEFSLLKKSLEGKLLLKELSERETSIGIPWAKRKGWIEFKQEEKGNLITATQKGKKAAEAPYPERTVLEKISRGKGLSEEERRLAEELVKRGLVEKKEAKRVFVELTKKGLKLAEKVNIGEEVNVIDKNFIVERRWEKVKMREYDVEAPAERVFAGKFHPLRALMIKIRDVFADMGFEEMHGSQIESSFWNFDALFQPQDHPARELADTFYLKTPKEKPLPHPELVTRVKRAHEKGWKYSWNPFEARKMVLRTHTTAVSARYCVETGEGKRKAPAKYFSIGRVYRNEAVDFKHLAEFHQVEGIIVWENATFCNLLGCLKTFYNKLGFEKIRFRPSYFPYTEPSLEIEVFFKEKGEWLELGGAGIFRPEVCAALWGKYPVLAWGLSLERPIMLLTGLKDIRTFYRNDLDWLRNSRTGGE